MPLYISDSALCTAFPSLSFLPQLLFRVARPEGKEGAHTVAQEEMETGRGRGVHVGEEDKEK